MSHDVVTPPDFDTVCCYGIPKDLRVGVRVAVVDVGLGPDWRVTVRAIVLMIVVLACGAAVGKRIGFTGSFDGAGSVGSEYNGSS